MMRLTTKPGGAAPMALRRHSRGGMPPGAIWQVAAEGCADGAVDNLGTGPVIVSSLS